MTEPRRRISTVSRRGAAILAILKESGPMSLAQLAEELGERESRVRYATTALVEDGKAHIHHTEPVDYDDGVRRMVCFYAEGQDTGEVSRLDYVSTAHIQDIYLNWTRNAVPTVQRAHDGEVVEDDVERDSPPS